MEDTTAAETTIEVAETDSPPTALSAAAEARRAARASALQAATQAAADFDGSIDDPDTNIVAVSAMRDALTTVIEAFGPRGRESKGPRVQLEKAGFEEVGAYFASTGLTRKELASAAGVSTSVIATVQNEKGDRWSTATFEAKRALIDQWMVDHADEIQTRQDADAAVEAAKAAKASAKVARQTAALTKNAQSAQAPMPARTGKTAKAAAKPGRPSPARRAANKKGQTATVAVQA